MAHNSFLSRFAGSRESTPVLPLHTKNLRHKPSEYDLDELSPRAEDSRLFSADPEAAFVADRKQSSKGQGRAPAVSFAYLDEPSSARASSRQRHNDSREYAEYRDHDGYNDYNDYNEYNEYDQPQSPHYPAKSKTNQPTMFAGPPPPIAQSMVMYRDVEQRGGSILERGSGFNSNVGASSIRLPTDTVIFDSQHPNASPRTSRARASRLGSFHSDSTWTILQRRERALQTEIQNYLNIQSSGLAAGLGRGPQSPSASPSPSPSQGRSSDGGGRSVRLPTERATASGAVIPVRQPKPRKLGLRAARAGLSRGISLFASLKAEEDAALEDALHARKKALAYLNRLSGRRNNIAKELHALETDGEEPLARELVTLHSAHKSTSEQIAELEGQLAMLKQQQRMLSDRIQEATSQRESGLSGYRGALKEVDSQLTAVLRRPPIQPLDIEAMGAEAAARQHSVDNGIDEGRIRLDDNDQAASKLFLPAEVDDASAGIEFLRLLPERRTEDMARFWWETEVRILERRRKEVGNEHKALEEGGAMWLEAAQLVSDFEANLRKEMTGQGAETKQSDKGKGRLPTPEEKMRSQLANMTAVIAGLRMHLRTAQGKGWNLLICAIGAELEAFREARRMLRQSLRAAGFDVEEDADTEDEDADLETASKADMAEKLEKLERRAMSQGTGSPDNGLLLDGMSKTTPGLVSLNVDDEDNMTTPRLARSTSDALSSLNNDEKGQEKGWLYDQHDDQAASESDDNNEVPADLFAAHESCNEYNEGHEEQHDEHDSSDNEVPADLFSGQPADDDDDKP